MNLKFFKWLHNIQTKRFFNTVKGTGPCLGEHSPAIYSNVFEKFHTIQTRNLFDTVKWAGSCLGEHDEPFFWRLLTICITSKRKDSSTPQIQLGRDKGCWGARPSHKLEWFLNGCITYRRKKLSNTVKETGPCLGEHGPAINLMVFEKLHTIQTTKCFNTVKWAGSCSGEHDQPLIWRLLTICITSRRNGYSTPRNELGRDRGCWKAAQP